MFIEIKRIYDEIFEPKGLVSLFKEHKIVTISFFISLGILVCVMINAKDKFIWTVFGAGVFILILHLIILNAEKNKNYLDGKSEQFRLFKEQMLDNVFYNSKEKIEFLLTKLDKEIKESVDTRKSIINNIKASCVLTSGVFAFVLEEFIDKYPPFFRGIDKDFRLFVGYMLLIVGATIVLISASLIMDFPNTKLFQLKRMKEDLAFLLIIWDDEDF